MRASERIGLVLAFVLACCLLWLPKASAASAPAPSQLSSVVVASDRSVSGLLSVRGSLEGGVDAGSLSVTIGTDRYAVRTIPVNQVRRATMIVIDTSGSMGQSGMDTVGQAVASFLSVVPADVQVGVVAFSDAARVVVPLTVDRGAVRRGVATLTASGDTTIYDGVVLALHELGSIGDRNLLLLSDGADTKSAATKAQVLAAITASKTHAQVIGFNTGSSDTAVLGEIAAAGQGPVSAAGDTVAVQQAFTSAAKQLESQVRWVVQPSDTLSATQTVTISGTAGGQPFSASAAVDLGKPVSQPGTTNAVSSVPAAPLVAAPTVDVPVLLGLPLVMVIAIGAIFVGLLGVVTALAAPLFRRRGASRAQAIEDYVNIGTAPRVEARSSAGLTDGIVAFGEKVMKDRESTSRLMSSLQRADLPLRPGEWWVLRILSVVGCAALGLVLLNGVALVGLLLGGVLGIFVPAMVLRFLVKRRLRKFERQLPDVLSLLASSLTTGFSLLQSLDAVAHDSAEPAAKEFSRAMAETRIGSDIEDSLQRLAIRMGSKNMEWTSMAIKIQRQVGGNLAETLRGTAATLREREMLSRQVAALSAEGKLSAYILVALPIGIFLFSMHTNYDYVSLLWTTFLGAGMLVAGIISLGIGILWMRKVVVVEV